MLSICKGRFIENLVNNQLNDGYHSITWNAKNNSSGVYFVRMVIDNEVHTQKILLMK